MNGVLWEQEFTVGDWHQLGMHVRAHLPFGRSNALDRSCSRQVRWSEDAAAGRIRLWWDGQLALDQNVATKGPESVYFCQPGMHRDPHDSTVDTIYMTDFVCTNTSLEAIRLQSPAE